MAQTNRMSESSDEMFGAVVRVEPVKPDALKK